MIAKNYPCANHAYPDLIPSHRLFLVGLSAPQTYCAKCTNCRRLHNRIVLYLRRRSATIALGSISTQPTGEMLGK